MTTARRVAGQAPLLRQRTCTDLAQHSAGQTLQPRSPACTIGSPSFRSTRSLLPGSWLPTDPLSSLLLPSLESAARSPPLTATRSYASKPRDDYAIAGRPEPDDPGDTGYALFPSAAQRRRDSPSSDRRWEEVAARRCQYPRAKMGGLLLTSWEPAAVRCRHHRFRIRHHRRPRACSLKVTDRRDASPAES